MTTKKAIIIGALCAIGVSLTAYAVKKGIDFKPKTITESYADNEETLANTTWYFINSNLTKPTLSEGTQAIQYNVNFTYANDNTQYTKFYIGTIQSFEIPIVRYGKENGTYTNAFGANQWSNQDYRIVTFTSGLSINDTNLINWIKQNATKLPNSIENTSWEIKESATSTQGYGIFTINTYNNGFESSLFGVGYSNSQTATENSLTLQYSNLQNSTTWNHYRQSSKITFTTGTDKTNKRLIAWLSENATQMTFSNSIINTKWIFENQLYIPSRPADYQNYNIQFTTSNKVGYFIRVGTETNTLDYALRQNNETPYIVTRVYNDGWAQNKYKTIIITANEQIVSTGEVDTQIIRSFLISNATGTNFTPIPTNPDDFDIEDGNFVSIQSLMLKILTMPFTFIIQAFDVTLWPNTAWEFNIGNFILAIIAICAVLFIIKVFTSGFSVIGNYTNNRNQNKLTKSKIETNKTSAELNRAKTEKVKKETK